jgi:hypothetical protein
MMNVTMGAHYFSRDYLGSLTSLELVRLAEGLGVDVPEDMNRRLLLAEILDAGDEGRYAVEGKSRLRWDDVVLDLPRSYNETRVTAILRTPVWLYVYWDLSDADLRRLHAHPNRGLELRVWFRDEDGQSLPSSFLVPLAPLDREQYVLLPSGNRAVTLDLAMSSRGMVLATTAEVRLPHTLPDLFATVDAPVPPLMALSGFRELLRSHYINHRQNTAAKA